MTYHLQCSLNLHQTRQKRVKGIGKPVTVIALRVYGVCEKEYQKRHRKTYEVAQKG